MNITEKNAMRDLSLPFRYEQLVSIAELQLGFGRGVKLGETADEFESVGLVQSAALTLFPSPEQYGVCWRIAGRRKPCHRAFARHGPSASAARGLWL